MEKYGAPKYQVIHRITIDPMDGNVVYVPLLWAILGAKRRKVYSRPQMVERRGKKILFVNDLPPGSRHGDGSFQSQ